MESKTRGKIMFFRDIHKNGIICGKCKTCIEDKENMDLALMPVPLPNFMKKFEKFNQPERSKREDVN